MVLTIFLALPTN